MFPTSIYKYSFFAFAYFPLHSAFLAYSVPQGVWAVFPNHIYYYTHFSAFVKPFFEIFFDFFSMNFYAIKLYKYAGVLIVKLLSITLVS